SLAKFTWDSVHGTGFRRSGVKVQSSPLPTLDARRGRPWRRGAGPKRVLSEPPPSLNGICWHGPPRARFHLSLVPAAAPPCGVHQRVSINSALTQNRSRG